MTAFFIRSLYRISSGPATEIPLDRPRRNQRTGRLDDGAIRHDEQEGCGTLMKRSKLPTGLTDTQHAHH
jgi:hypothetical protein